MCRFSGETVDHLPCRVQFSELFFFSDLLGFRGCYFKKDQCLGGGIGLANIPRIFGT